MKKMEMATVTGMMSVYLEPLYFLSGLRSIPLA